MPNTGWSFDACSNSGIVGMTSSAKFLDLRDNATVIKYHQGHQATNTYHGFRPLGVAMKMGPEICAGLHGIEQSLAWVRIIRMHIPMLPQPGRLHRLLHKFIQVVHVKHINTHSAILHYICNAETICLTAVSGENSLA